MMPASSSIRAALAASLALLALCATTLPAQSTGPYRVSGRVVNAITGEPVRDAIVSLLAEQDSQIVASTLTDADGAFALDHLRAAKFPLTASRRGYRTSFYDEHDDFNSAIVTGPDQDTTGITFKLTPGAVIYGSVTADGGDPVEGANVTLFRAPAAPGERVTQIQSTTTDDTGAYEFADLGADAFYIAVQAEPWYAMHSLPPRAQSSAPLDVAYPITFFDSTTDQASAAPIALAAGTRQEANIALHAVPTVHVNVSNTGRNGAPSAVSVEQSVFGIPIPRGDFETSSAQPGSTFITGLPPGRYTVTHGDPPRTVELDASANAEIDAEAGAPTATVTGIARTAGGAIPPEGTAELDPDQDRSGRRLLQAGLSKGQFHFDGVPPGQWSLTILSTETASATPVISIAQGAHITAGNQLTVADRPLTLSVLVSRSPTRINGFARKNGKSAPGVMIVLVPRDPAAYASLVRRDQSDSDGSFSLRDVPPGRYTVIAIDQGWKLDWRRYQTIARYLSGGVAVEVPEHAPTAIQLARTVEAVNP